LSSSIPRLTLLQTTLLVSAIAILLEIIQLIPRPGILERVHYTFDCLDIAATLLSVSVGFVVARFISNNY
jgi:glycopeptide antibiotics resistance protein